MPRRKSILLMSVLSLWCIGGVTIVLDRTQAAQAATTAVGTFEDGVMLGNGCDIYYQLYVSPRENGQVSVNLTLPGESGQFGYVRFEAFSNGFPAAQARVSEKWHSGDVIGFTALLQNLIPGHRVNIVAFPFMGGGKPNWQLSNGHCTTPALTVQVQ